MLFYEPIQKSGGYLYNIYIYLLTGRVFGGPPQKAGTPFWTTPTGMVGEVEVDRDIGVGVELDLPRRDPFDPAFRDRAVPESLGQGSGPSHQSRF